MSENNKRCSINVSAKVSLRIICFKTLNLFGFFKSFPSQKLHIYRVFISVLIPVWTITATKRYAISIRSNPSHTLRIPLVRTKFKSERFFLSTTSLWNTARMLHRKLTLLTDQAQSLSSHHILIIFTFYFFLSILFLSFSKFLL